MRKVISLVLCVVPMLACVSSGKYDAKAAEADKLKKELQDESGRKAALEAKAAGLEAKAADLEKQLATTRSELDQVAQSRAQLEVKTAKLEAKSAEYEKLADSLRGQIQAGQVELSELKGRMTVKLRDKILFTPGSAAVNKDGRSALDAVADAFKGLQGKNVIVTGYTDNVPVGSRTRFKDNWELSTARAISVVKYLESKGVDPRMLGAAGFSEFRPLVANDTDEGRSQNRRIEVVLTAADYTPPEIEVKK
jgi:chemotaxis protein MotB